jgi:hypothetical protein
MRTEYTFSMAVGQASIALPARFLDPIGKVYDTTNVTDYEQVIQTNLLQARSYDTSPSGTFGNNPFTTTAGSALVAVQMANHGLTQGSVLIVGNGPAVNGIAMTGGFPVTSITDANNFVVDTQGDGASGTGSGGGAGVTWTANKLISGSPSCWGVWDEQINFDTAFDQAAVCKLPYFRQPLLLSASNQSNFLTNRYPNLLRVACLASAAQFMKDDEEFNKNVQVLTNLAQSIASADDLSYRGATFGTDTP